MAPMEDVEAAVREDNPATLLAEMRDTGRDLVDAQEPLPGCAGRRGELSRGGRAGLCGKREREDRAVRVAGAARVRVRDRPGIRSVGRSTTLEDHRAVAVDGHRDDSRSGPSVEGLG